MFNHFSRLYMKGLKYYQKQPSRGVLRKMCSENMKQIYRRAPMPKCDSNNIKKKKVVLFPEICRVKIFLSPTLPDMSNVYENIYFLFQKNTRKQKNFHQQIYSYKLLFFLPNNKRQGSLFFNKEKYCQGSFLSVNFFKKFN